MSLLASSSQLPELDTNKVVTFAGLDPGGPVWTRLSAALGNPPGLRILAMMPTKVLQAAIKNLRILTGPAEEEGRPPPS